MYTWATDIKSALLLNNNVTDDTGNYTWTNSGGVPFSSIIFYEGADSAGPFSSSKNINANITDAVETVDFWAYVPSGSAIGTLWACGAGIKLYYNAGLIYFSDSTYGQIGGFAVPLDTWFRVQITFDGTFETIYINGVEQAEQQAPGVYATGVHRLGNDYATDDPFGGYIDLVKISTVNYEGVEPLPVPVLTLISVSPNQGPQTGGTAVTLTGLYFSTAAQVLFDGISAINVVIVDDHTITCVTPADSPGTFIPVEVDSATESSVLTHGFKYNAVVVIPPDIGNGQFIFEKRNYVIDTDGNGTPATITPTSPLIQDNKHTHFNVDTGAIGYTKLSAGSNIVIDFGTAQAIKKITAFLYPKQNTYYALESVYNNAAIKIEHWDGAVWQTLNWASFNEFYGLPTAQLTSMGTYAAYTSTAGLVSVWDSAGISTQKLRFTAPGVDIGITEIEACDLLILEPMNIRVNEIATALGEYQGIRVDGTFLDTDFSTYNNVQYRRNAFLSAQFKDQPTKYYGLLFVDSVQIDEQVYQTYIECVNIYDKLAPSRVNINADIGLQDYAQVIEWLLACADIYRDLVNISVNIKNFNYIPENTDVQTELQNVLASGGDIVMLTQDGLFAVKSRIAETPTIATIPAYTDNWDPQFNLFVGEYLNFTMPQFVDLFAPIMGFSLAETYDNCRAVWGNGWLIDTKNFQFFAGVDDNHYKIKLTTLTINHAGYWRMRGNVLNTALGVVAHYHSFWAGQFIISQGQGTVNVTARFTGFGTTGYSFSDTTTGLDTSSSVYRIAYYLYDLTTDSVATIHVGKIIFNQTSGTVVLDNDAYTSFVVAGGYNLGVFSTVDLQVESYNSAGASVYIEAVGICGIHHRSVVFEASTPSAVSFLNLSVPTATSFAVFTLTAGDIDPVQSFSGSALSAAGDNIKVILIPLSTALYMSSYSFAPTSEGQFYSTFSATWNEITLTSNITVTYFPAAVTDIENGTIQVYPRDFKYLKSARNVNEDVIYNRLQIMVNNFTNNGADYIYDNETAFNIQTTAFSVTTSQTLDVGVGLNLEINVFINSVFYDYNYQPGTYYNPVMDCDIVFSYTDSQFHFSITPRGTSLIRAVQFIKISQAAQIYDNELSFTIHAAQYTTTIQTAPLNFLKQSILTINATISGVNYTFRFAPSASSQYNSTLDCDITFNPLALGLNFIIAPRSLTFDRTIKFVKITAFPWDNISQTTDIINFAASQNSYGVIEQDISNTKVNSEAQSILIQKQYSRFLSLPVVFLQDGATCDLILAIDFAKYALIQDTISNLTATYKIYEYEITMDIANNDYQMTIKGRAQSHSQY